MFFPTHCPICNSILILNEYDFHSELNCKSNDFYRILIDCNKVSETFHINNFFIANDFYKWESAPQSLLIHHGLVKITTRYRIPPTITNPCILEVMKYANETEVL